MTSLDHRRRADQLATGLVGTRSPYGHVKNAFDERYISGGSSSGSAVAVATGMASFSLGTDTAGSGRVPAAFNNLFGWKPSVGLLSTRGVRPACASLDCVSVFGLGVNDVRSVARTVARYDPEHAYSRALRSGPRLARSFRVAVPREPFFANDAEAKGLWNNTLRALSDAGAEIIHIDYHPFQLAAKLLYEGPWVAERYDANRNLFLDGDSDALDPVVASILRQSTSLRAYDAFGAFRELEEIKRRAQDILADVDCLIHPTAPTLPLLREDVVANPIELNSQCGHYTNHMNLLDMCGLAVPVGFGADSNMPFGVTISAFSGHDDLLFDVADRLQVELRIKTGGPRVMDALGEDHAVPDVSTIFVEEDRTQLVVCGAHMNGLGLNHQLTSLGGHFVREAKTHPSYRMIAFETMSPPRPGIFRSRSSENATSISCEVWSLPTTSLGRFATNVVAPLCIGDVELADGNVVKGFLCQEGEAHSDYDATEISQYGGWRSFLARENE